MGDSYEYRFCHPLAAPAEGGSRPPHCQHLVDNGILIERDFAVAMRDGTRVFVDVFRPADERVAAPPLIAWSPYGKHSPTSFEAFPGSRVGTTDVCPYAVVEGPEPSYWVPRGYAIVQVNTPSSTTSGSPRRLLPRGSTCRRSL